MLEGESRLQLPDRPAALADAGVAAWREPVTIDSYLPEPPDRYPAYLDRRVYQGASGRVYPLPFHDRISPTSVPHEWDGVHLENRWLRVMVLPELGGRIHVGYDRSAGYDFFYRNGVIKPALVGLAGPWIAGGVEFNWPQHHRPATFLPTDVEIEHEPDGAVTVWCSDHDPFARMKGMHGIRLRPDRATVEVRARLYNRSETTQTFLWWANVAARVHDDYQSFFPREMRVVADHAKRAVTAFPAADRPYYGIDYPARRATGGDRLDWYRNIPVPTSYMCVGSREGFFGGYDHAARAGFVHVADPHTAVGKKQWTWGNAAFGHAWDRNLSDDGAAYVELMAGVFTDNQPDFSCIAPGETKVFSQVWYPIQEIGPVHAATVDAAVRVDVEPDGVRVGLAVTAERSGCRIRVEDASGTVLAETVADVAPGSPHRTWIEQDVPDRLHLRVLHGNAELVNWDSHVPDAPDAVPATEPPAPADVASVEELALIGAHLEQYRHATRSPDPYWREALRRDPGHVASSVGLAGRAYRRAEFAEAEALLTAAVDRLTTRNANPADTTPLYLLGLVLERLGRQDEAYARYGAASWTRAWRAPAGYRMARLDAAAGRDAAALDRLADVRRVEPEHLQARALTALLLRRTGRAEEAAELLRDTLALDPLDWWTRDLAGLPLTTDAQTCLDVALEYAGVGESDAALRVLDIAADREADRPLGQTAAGPLIEYHRAAVAGGGDDVRAADRTWCFPSRLDDVAALEHADPSDARALALLGHWRYAAGRADDAIAAWRGSAALDPSDPVVWRNLGLAAWNHLGDADEARAAYDRALAVAGADARLVFESDQLDARRGVPPEQRLDRLLDVRGLVETRDDAVVALAHLLLTAGRLEEARALLLGRTFQPWEGGEGEVLRAWDRLCRLAAARPGGSAVAAIDAALDPPASLGEARHPLASTAALQLLRGDALAAMGDRDAALDAWERAARDGDFLVMSADPHSEATYFSVLALRRLGREAEADRRTESLRAFVDSLETAPLTVDYFATSLTLLLFTEDPAVARRRRVAFLRAQLDVLDAAPRRARDRLDALLAEDPHHLDALELAAALHPVLEEAASEHAGTKWRQSTMTIPAHLPERLTITLWDFSWYVRTGPGEPFEDLDAAFAQAVERGYNTVRICAMPFLLFGSGVDTSALRLERLGEEYAQGMRWYDVKAPTTIDAREHLLELFRAARRHDCYVIVSSWEYQQSSSFGAEPDWWDALRAVPPAERPERLAAAHADLLDLLIAEGLDDRVAFTEIHNEVQVGHLAEGMQREHAVVELGPLLEKAVDAFKTRHPERPCTVNYGGVPHASMRGIPQNIDVLVVHPYIYGVLGALIEEFGLRGPVEAFPQEAAAALLRPGAPPVAEWTVPAQHRWRLDATIVRAAEVYVHDWADPDAFDRWLYDHYGEHRVAMDEKLRLWLDVAADWAAAHGVPLVLGEGWVGYTPLHGMFEEGPVGAQICRDAVRYARERDVWGTVVCSNAAPQHPMWADVALQQQCNEIFTAGKRR